MVGGNLLKGKGKRNCRDFGRSLHLHIIPLKPPGRNDAEVDHAYRNVGAAWHIGFHKQGGLRLPILASLGSAFTGIFQKVIL